MGYVSTDTHCIFRFNSFRFTAAIVQNKRLTDCPQWPRTLFLFLRLLLSDFQCTKTFQVTSGINVSGEVLKVGEHESAVMVDAEWPVWDLPESLWWGVRHGPAVKPIRTTKPQRRQRYFQPACFWSWEGNIVTLLQLYTVSGKKTNQKYFRHNFIKYWPIFKILPVSQSAWNLQ